MHERTVLEDASSLPLLSCSNKNMSTIVTDSPPQTSFRLHSLRFTLIMLPSLALSLLHYIGIGMQSHTIWSHINDWYICYLFMAMGWSSTRSFTVIMAKCCERDTEYNTLLLLMEKLEPTPTAKWLGIFVIVKGKGNMIESDWNDMGMEINGMDHISGKRAFCGSRWYPTWLCSGEHAGSYEMIVNMDIGWSQQLDIHVMRLSVWAGPTILGPAKGLHREVECLSVCVFLVSGSVSVYVLDAACRLILPLRWPST